MPEIACTKSPPKRVVTFALRWVTRMTVSAPETLASSIASTVRAPKSRVAVEADRALGLLAGADAAAAERGRDGGRASGRARGACASGRPCYRTWKTMRLPPRRRTSSRLCALSTALTSST